MPEWMYYIPQWSNLSYAILKHILYLQTIGENMLIVLVPREDLIEAELFTMFPLFVDYQASIIYLADQCFNTANIPHSYTSHPGLAWFLDILGMVVN